LRVRPYLTADGTVDGAVVVLVDIDALKRSAQAIAEARDYAENTIATVREPLLVLDPELRVESANSAFYRAFRVVPDETIGRVLFDLGNRQWDIPALRSLLHELLPRNSSVENFEVEHDFPQLGRRAMLVNARRINDPARATQRILLAIEDISDRKREESARALRADELQRANERLHESELRLRRFMQQLPGLAWIKDLNGRYVYANDAAEKAFGVRLTDLVGKTDEDVFPPETAALFRDHDRRALETETGIQAIEALPHSDGTVHHSIVSKFSIPGLEGEAAMLGGVAFDITERKRYEDALSEADRRKNEFLAMLAHELRNPLAPIRNSLELMRRSVGAESSSAGPIGSAIEIMERQVGQMVRLVDDLLDVGRISRGKIELRRERVELASIAHSALDTVRPLLERMGHALKITMPPGPLYVNADSARLAQVVGNLLNNACKFTGRGGHIWLAVEGESGSGDASGEVVIRVRDNGVGIAANQLPRIFDMFAQIDNALERSTTGLGIGLTLVKTLVELHGGTVEARSGGVGHGTEFVVRLPIVADPSQPLLEPAPTEPTAGAARRVLVVDDNRDEVESLAMLLQLGGHETHIAHDGLEAVEAAKALQPDVILLDIGLPGLNGYEAARRIREQQKDKRIVLVALTGWGKDDDRRRSKQAGFDAHLVKPVDPTTLGKLLDELGAGPRG
jgi:PAS domain S-box-containing protein